MNPYNVNGLFLHAAAVVADGGALLFLGHSTSGKSTISQLLARAFPHLADDAVFASRDQQGLWHVVDGKFRLENSTVANWEGAVRLHSEDVPAIPLLGCLRIHKSRNVHVTRLVPVETARCLMDAVMEIDVQRKFGRIEDKARKNKPDIALVRRMRLRWFHQAADIAHACPGWRLWFSRDSHLFDLVDAVFAIAVQARGQAGESSQL